MAAPVPVKSSLQKKLVVKKCHNLYLRLVMPSDAVFLVVSDPSMNEL
jgi:hypothetical protein